MKTPTMQELTSMWCQADLLQRYIKRQIATDKNAPIATANALINALTKYTVGPQRIRND